MIQTPLRKRSVAAAHTREAHPERRQAAPAARLVDTVRGAVRRLVATGGEEGLDIAIALVERHYERVANACPVTEDLRPWQLLASDLSVALERHDRARAEQALKLADQIRATVFMIARNPASELALRPASRRVLLALDALGGRAELATVRERSGHSATHLSNVLKPLRAHGLVAFEASATDRRSRTLVLTPDGKAAIAGQDDKPRATEYPYRGYLDVRPVGSNEAAYPLSEAALDLAE